MLPAGTQPKTSPHRSPWVVVWDGGGEEWMGRGTGRRERRHEKLEEALDGLVVSGREKNQRPSDQQWSIFFFIRQHWGKFRETGWSAIKRGTVMVLELGVSRFGLSSKALSW